MKPACQGDLTTTHGSRRPKTILGVAVVLGLADAAILRQLSADRLKVELTPAAAALCVGAQASEHQQTPTEDLEGCGDL